MNLFEYAITVYTRETPARGPSYRSEFLTLTLHREPDAMRDIVARLRVGWPAPRFEVGACILDHSSTELEV